MAESGRQSGFKLQLSLVFFLLLFLFSFFLSLGITCFPSFFSLFLISWYVFPLFTLLALYLSFTKFVINVFLSY